MARLADESSYTLVICEKPDVAKRIAFALKDDNVTEVEKNNVKIFILSMNGKKYVICSALGHLYTVGDPTKNRHIYPVFDIEWFPADAFNKKIQSSIRIKIIHELSGGVDLFINACDFDLEGETIGYNILKYACGEKQETSFRAKFSTLTEDELKESFKQVERRVADGLAKAGRARHVLDFIFGVNLSRALTESYFRTTGFYKVISIGRVQGPTLKYVVERETEINTFVPTPYWKVNAKLDLNGRILVVDYENKQISHYSNLLTLKNSCKGQQAVVRRVNKSIFEYSPPPAFNLGDLQKESFKVFRYSPSQTSKIAEDLYLKALISYPRTSSQKLPPSINYKKILNGLQCNHSYYDAVTEILKGSIIPKQGDQDDPAHPAIYPTGKTQQYPLSNKSDNIYNLIVKRFLATFCNPAIIQHLTATIDINGYSFIVTSKLVISEGWLKHNIKYSSISNDPIPNLTEGQILRLIGISSREMFHKHSPRYSQGTLLEKMEKEEIGTKSTRGEVIETLFKRGYIAGTRNINATEIALSLIESLEKYSPDIVSSEMIKNIETLLEDIRKGVIDEKESIQNYLDKLLNSLILMKYSEQDIGKKISEAVFSTKKENSRLGTCPICKTDVLSIIRSRKSGKRFVGCSEYNGGCRASAPLPQKGSIRIQDRPCISYGWPTLYVVNGKKRWRLCINTSCESKKRIW